MTQNEFDRWKASRWRLSIVVEFERLFLGNHPDPQEIRAFFIRLGNSENKTVGYIIFSPSASRLLDKELTQTYDEALWHIIYGVLSQYANSHQKQHLIRLFWACHVPESILARNHVALISHYHSGSLLHFIKFGKRSERFLESLSPRIRQELCKRKVPGWEDMQWTLPLNASGLRKSIEPGLLRAIDEDDAATFAILKTFTRKTRPTLAKIAIAHHAWKILAQEAIFFQKPMARISLRSILLSACSHPDNQRVGALIHQLEKLSPGIVRNTVDACGNDPLWYTLYSGIRGIEGRRTCRWTPIPKKLVDTLVAYGCDPARRNRNGISFQAMNAELMSGRDIKVSPENHEA